MSTVECVLKALTEREQQVLELMAQGLVNKDIATKLGISYETVKEHVQNILYKIDVPSRTEAAIWYLTQQPFDDMQRQLIEARELHQDAIAKINKQLERLKVVPKFRKRQKSKRVHSVK